MIIVFVYSLKFLLVWKNESQKKFSGES